MWCDDSGCGVMIGSGKMTAGFTIVHTVVHTHPSGLDETDGDGDDLDQDDTAGIVVVLVSHPEGNSDKLKDVKWMENLKRQIKDHGETWKTRPRIYVSIYNMYTTPHRHTPHSNPHRHTPQTHILF